MREGLGAACEAARPRLCGLLRRILRPQPACGSRRARYRAAPGPPGRGAGGSAPGCTRRAPDPPEPWFPVKIEGWNIRCRVPMNIHLECLACLERIRGSKSVATKTRRSAHAPVSRVYEGWSRIVRFSARELSRFFGTGAATPFRTDRREQKSSCFTNKIDFPKPLSHPHPWCTERWGWGGVGTAGESESRSAPNQPAARPQRPPPWVSASTTLQHPF